MHLVFVRIQERSGTHDMMPLSSLAFPDVVLQQAIRQQAARLDNYMRIVDLRRMAQISCGATQESIESHTFPHKYKRVRVSVFIMTTGYNCSYMNSRICS